MQGLGAINLGLKFLLELGCFALAAAALIAAGATVAGIAFAAVAAGNAALLAALGQLDG